MSKESLLSQSKAKPYLRFGRVALYPAPPPGSGRRLNFTFSSFWALVFSVKGRTYTVLPPPSPPPPLNPTTPTSNNLHLEVKLLTSLVGWW